MRQRSIIGFMLAFVVSMSIGDASAGTLVVETGADPIVNGTRFQAALDQAQCGDTIILQAGARYGTTVAFVTAGGPQGYPFTLRNKVDCAGAFITIQTSALDGIPPAGQRVTPAHASAMPKLVSYANQEVVLPEPSAGWYRFVGIELTNDSSVALQGGHTGSAVGSPLGGYYPHGQWAHHVTFDRCYFHPVEEVEDPTSNYRSMTRAVGIDGAHIVVEGSHLGGFFGWYRAGHLAGRPDELIDTEAITMITGPGPVTVSNNFLEAWFNVVFTGGGGNSTANTATVTASDMTHVTLSQSANLAIGDLIALKVPPYTNAGGAPSEWTVGKVSSLSGTVVTFEPTGPDGTSPSPPSIPGEARWNGINPTDVRFTRNTFNHRADWKTTFGASKSWAELKNGVRITFDGNIFQGDTSNIAPQNRNQTGSSPWSRNEDTLISNNIFTHGASFVAGLDDGYHTTMPGRGFTVTNNLFGFVPSSGQQYYLALTAGGSGWTFTHNTMRSNNDAMLFGGVAAQTVFRDNLINSGANFLSCQTAPNTTDTCWPGLEIDHNLVINNSSAAPPGYMATSMLVADDSAVGFVNVVDADAGGDYHGYALASGTAYKGTASDGTDPGVNFQLLDDVLDGVVFCGDAQCNPTESCASCAGDCGACPADDPGPDGEPSGAGCGCRTSDRHGSPWGAVVGLVVAALVGLSGRGTSRFGARRRRRT